MESITYYTRDGVDYGVLALTKTELQVVSAALGFALDRDNGVDARAHDIRILALQGIQRLEGREGGPPPYQLHSPDWAD